MKTLPMLCAAGLLFGQNPPVVKNGQVETRAFSGDFQAQLRSTSPAWFGYAVKSDHRSNQQCDGNYQQPIQLEGSDTFAVLLRVENNQVEKVKFYSLTCELDTGGLPFVWLTGVSGQASWLTSKNDGGRQRAFGQQRDLFISQHAGSEATDLLINEAKNNPSTHVRGQALFWLAQKAGARSAAAITDAILNDPDTGVKKKAVFALSQLAEG